MLMNRSALLLAGIVLLLASGAVYAINNRKASGVENIPTNIQSTKNSSALAPTAISLFPTADALVRAGSYTNTNYGADTMLVLKKSADPIYTRSSYLKFDFTSVQGTVNSATLRLYAYIVQAGGASTITAEVISDDNWTENGITYSNQPTSNGIPISTFSISATGAVLIDVTSAVKSQTDGLLTIRLTSATDLGVNFKSKEAVKEKPFIAVNDSQAPTAPTDLVSSNVSYGSVSLSWKASTDDLGVSSYEVFKDGVSVGTTFSTSIAVTGLLPGTTYLFTVKARDAANNSSAASQAISVTTNAADGEAPSVPANLTANNITPYDFKLSWSPSTDNIGVTGYDVFKDGVLYSSTISTTLLIHGLSPSKSYSMTVKAKDGINNLSAPATLIVSTIAATPTNRVNNFFVGTNNPGIDYSPDRIFADAMRSHRNCSKIASPNTDNATKDENYWPTEDCIFLVWSGLNTNANHGTYKLYFNGSADVTTSDAILSNKVFNAATNQTTADLLIASPTNNNLWLTFRNTKRTVASATNTGVTNVKLMLPTVPGGTTTYPENTLFRNEALTDCSAFKGLRGAGWCAVGENQDSVWTDRTLMQHARQSPPKRGRKYGWEGRGASYESFVMFCNAANKDAWINVPHKADDDFITRLAQLLKYGSDGVNPYTFEQANPVYPPLNSNLKIYIEYSNEVWNDGFSQTGWVYQQAKNYGMPLIFDGNPGQWELGMRFKAMRNVQISAIFRKVFGDNAMMSRVRPVLCHQAGNIDRTQQVLQFIDRYYNKSDSRSDWNDPHPVNYYFFGSGGSFYWSTMGAGGVTVDNIWTKGQFDVYNNPGYYNLLAADAAWARKFGLKYVCYEGDSHPTWSGGDDVVIAALHSGTWDSRGTQNTLDHIQVLNQVDCDLMAFLTNNGFPGSTWALRNVVNPSNSPQLDAVVFANSASPYPISVGSVPPFTRPGNSYDSYAYNARNPDGLGDLPLISNSIQYCASYFFHVNKNGYNNLQVQYSSTAQAKLTVECCGKVVGSFDVPNTNGSIVSTPFINLHCDTDTLYSIRCYVTKGTLKLSSITVGEGLASEINNVSIGDHAISIYPNPASNMINIEFEELLKAEIMVSMVDLKDRFIYRKVFSDVSRINIPTLNLPKGLIILSITSGSKLVNKKILVL
jgi:hypothetical protein